MDQNTQTNIFNEKQPKQKSYEVRFAILLAINLVISAILFAASFIEKDLCFDSCSLGVLSSEVKMIAILTVIPAIIALYTSVRPFFLLKKTNFKTSLKVILTIILSISIFNIIVTPTESITYDRYNRDYRAYYGKDTHHFCELHANSSYCNIASIADISDNVVACSDGISDWNGQIDLAKKYIANGDYENCLEYPDGAICDRVIPTVEKYSKKEKISQNSITNQSFMRIYEKKVTSEWGENLDLLPCELVITEEKKNLGEELRKLSEACDINPKKYGCSTKK